MAKTVSNVCDRGPTDIEAMHALYREGGAKSSMAPHVVYADPSCPHEGCDARIQAIDFRVESYGPSVHDPLVKAWWDDTGFAGRCPRCQGWIHFTIRSKTAITADEAARLPNLPENWHEDAIVL